MTRPARSWWPCALLVLAAIALTSRARATPPAWLDLATIASGEPLQEATFVLRDPEGTATLDDVMRADVEGRFERPASGATFGFTRDAIWVRFEARNPSDHAVDWLLELSYPHLDWVDLHIVHEDGRREHRRGGDHLPFSVREIEHPNLLFEQTTPRRQTVRYYLRARSEGAVRIPLVAWEPREFFRDTLRGGVALWLFYGAMLIMAWYNLCVALVVRSREYAYLAGILASLVGIVGALSGQVFQFLLPNQPALANRALVIFVALLLVSIQLLARTALATLATKPRILRLHPYVLATSWLLVAVATLAPPSISQRVVFAGVVAYVPAGGAALWAVQRARDATMRYSVFSFYALIVGLPIVLLAYANLIPPHPLALWAGHIGCAAYCVITSLALPARLRTVSAHLVTLNTQLSTNVDELKVALGRAERATEEAHRATLVKDEFMATMSHELRTPLNAIINVPQGLLEDFPTVRSATCGACGSQFVLDPGDSIDADTVCPDCQERGTLRADTITQYLGKPAHTARFLAKIERSGRHLLQMVNGVLDFSKMEAGRMELALEPVDVGKLLDETVDELIDVAHVRGIDIALHLADDPEPGLGDAVRLRQVLLNLLSNAIKFSAPGGVIDVRWRRDPDNDVISVTDRGIGIAPEDHARVFASFEQVHKGDTRKYGGTGLGLSISRSLVRMHGGELWVESRLGEGATFTFRIPRASATISDRVEHRGSLRPPPPASVPLDPP